ncbi:hypothetical protein E1A91_A04G046200v1 [Gossypium mustelinum]|uniref:Disease resistance protein At4g27190-like leucine-rich repeats domain-containing protein n=1 Tax=Gossypium mustelinum TaxID=34275 RepID=A0A5D2ZKQ9_GOSMU|nr:hypothetical protein E1A91_A04G046200v1 [Gossypium mustelinum]
MQCLIDASKQQVPITAFSNLRKLSLSCMFDLEEMCNVPQPQGFLQKLEEVKVEGCYNMQVLFPIVEFRGIEQEGPSRHLSLQSLKIVEIEGCVNLKYIFPMSVANSLGQLHTLKIKSCSQLEDIIQDRPLAYKCLLQSLRDVSLIDLPQLKGRDVNDIMFTQSSLQKLKVHNCPCISTRRESWYEKRDLETCSISRSLRIDKSEDACKQLFEDVESLELDDVEGHPKLIPSLDLGFSKLTSLDLGCYHSKQCLIDASKQQVPITAFSNLRKLSLSDMFDLEEMCNVPQLQGFLQKLEEVKVESCYNMQVLFPIVELRSIEQEGHSRHLSLQNLKIVEIEGCDNLKYIFPMSVANSLGQLHSLKIKSCSQLEDIIQGRPVAYKCLLQSLRDVSLIDLPQLKKRDVKGILLTQSSLQKLKVKDCPQLTPFIVSTNIQDLEFSEMTEKKQISNVTVPDGRGGTSTCTEYLTISNFEELFEYSGYNLSSLKVLRLSKLTELRVIWSAFIQVEHFKNLSKLTVQDCRRLRYIFSPTIARNLPQLWNLDISDCEELEQIIEKDQTPSQHHLQPICFPNLSWIIIRNCENLKCLFPITLAHGGLPDLEQLYLERVTKLEQVFEGDEGNVSKDEQTVIHLPRLTDLVLGRLPNLVSFSPVGYHFVFPSLEILTVRGCPNINTRFSVDSKRSVHAKTQALLSSSSTIKSKEK